MKVEFKSTEEYLAQIAEVDKQAMEVLQKAYRKITELQLKRAELAEYVMQDQRLGEDIKALREELDELTKAIQFRGRYHSMPLAMLLEEKEVPSFTYPKIGYIPSPMMTADEVTKLGGKNN